MICPHCGILIPYEISDLRNGALTVSYRHGERRLICGTSKPLTWDRIVRGIPDAWLREIHR